MPESRSASTVSIAALAGDAAATPADTRIRFDAVPRSQRPPDRPPRASATLVVLRDGAAGLEVLLLRRAEKGDLNSGAWVFPGGLLDPLDRQAHQHVVGLDDAAASRELGLREGGLDYVAAALRETFEEAGLLHVLDAAGAPVRWDALGADTLAQVQTWRERLQQGEASLDACCAAFGWRLNAADTVYLSHWLTPVGRAKRFDTRFFIVAAPPGQTATSDDAEMVDLRWLRPADALAPDAGLKLMTPTLKTLEALRGHADVAAAMAWARSPRKRELIMPHVATGSQGTRPVTPDEPCWAELRHIDPLGYGDARYEIVPGAVVRISDRVLRVSAPNGSVMTGPGTNSYFIGSAEADAWALLDAGPADPVHIQALLDAAPGRVTHLLVTHTHPDHSPAVAPLRSHWPDAVVGGRVTEHPEWQDTSFVPSQPLQGGERLSLAPGVTLRVVHTPGHASNHLCYLLEEEQMLFTGDHVMQGSTVVINPPDGDMRAYLASLAMLRDDFGPELQWLAPGHGFLIPQPVRAFDLLIRHRLQREAKVLRCLGELAGEAASDARVETEALLPRVYDDVPSGRLGVARRSLLAHLGKLVADGRVLASDRGWQLV